MRRSRRAWLPSIVALTAMLLVAPGPASGVTLDSKLIALVESASDVIGAPAGYVVIDRRGSVRHLANGLDPKQPIPVASASKWVAAAVIMTSVDRGELRLDDRVDRFLPELGSTVGALSLAELLSHRSGIDPELSLRLASAPTLEASVATIAAAPFVGAPGKTFAYGGSSMQIAARMAEKASGKSWQQLFDERLARPLGLRSGRWAHPLRLDAPAPQIAGGLIISLEDYATFLAMILHNGRQGRTRVLATTSISGMERDLTAGITDLRKPAVVPDGWRYGLGIWCETVEPDGRCSRVSSPGAFGVYPWIDRRARRAGLFFTRSTLPKVMPLALKLRDATLHALR